MGIFDIFKKKEEKPEHDYILKEDDDDLDYSNDDKMKEIAKAHHRNVVYHYKNEKKDLNVIDGEFLLLDKSIKKYENYVIKFDFSPEQQNFRNVRSASEFKYGSWHYWTEIRNLIEKENKGVCCVCGKISKDYQHKDKEKKITTNTEAHEQWKYIIRSPSSPKKYKKIQLLRKLEPLCFWCHRIKHANMHKKNIPMFNDLMETYSKLNKIDIEQAVIDFEFAEKRRETMKDDKFVLDMSLINSLKVECRFEGLFNCHTTKFNNFIEDEFKDTDE